MQQVTVSEVGLEGQQLIESAKVLVIGAGGLGTPLLMYLSAAGIGNIGIVDGDNVALSNLSRQFMYNDDEIGKSKVDLLASKLSKQNQAIRVNSFPVMLDDKNANNYIGQYDIICDCTDNAGARILIDKVCGQLQKPLVYGVVSGWDGYITVLHHKKKIVLEHIFSHQILLDRQILNCSDAGIINVTCGIAGSIQAAEVIKIALGISSKLDGGILVFNALEPAFRLFELK